MSWKEGELTWKWNFLREQLVTLLAVNRKSPGAGEFEKFLTDDFNDNVMNLVAFNKICYFLFGLICKEERDKLIKWPVINIQDQAKFRKGVSALTKDLIEKNPFCGLKKLNESYLVHPYHNQKKILDFVLMLSNLAIYLAVDGEDVFAMCNTNDLSANEIEIAKNTIKKIRLDEERIIKENEFPLSEFDSIKKDMLSKCVALKQENSNIEIELMKLKKYLIDNHILKEDSDIQLQVLKEMHDEKLNEMERINEELENYSKLGSEIVKDIKIAGEPIKLTPDDLGLRNKDANLADVTAEAYDKLNRIFDKLMSQDVPLKEKEDCYKVLKNLKEILVEEEIVLKSFILKCTAALESQFLISQV